MLTVLAGGSHRNSRHRFDASGHDHVVLPGDDGGRSKGNCLLARSAGPCQCHAGNAVGPAGGECCCTGDASGLFADLTDASPDHVVDRRRVESGPFSECTQHMCRQFGRMDLREGAAATADRCTYCVDDDGISHVSLLLFVPGSATVRSGRASSRSRAGRPGNVFR